MPEPRDDLHEWRAAKTWPEALLVALDRVERLRARYGDATAWRQAIYWRPLAYGFEGYWVISSHRRDGSRVEPYRQQVEAVSNADR